MSAINAAISSQHTTTQELQEQVWDLQELLEDAKAQIESHASLLQRLRVELRNKDRELSELKSLSAAAISEEVESKDAQIAHLRSKAWIWDKDHLLKEEAKTLRSSVQRFFELVLAESADDPSIRDVQRLFGMVPPVPLAVPSTSDSLPAACGQPGEGAKPDNLSIHSNDEMQVKPRLAPASKRAHASCSENDKLEPHPKRQNRPNDSLQQHHLSAPSVPASANASAPAPTIKQQSTSRIPWSLDAMDEDGELPKSKNPKKVAAGRMGGLRKALNAKNLDEPLK